VEEYGTCYCGLYVSESVLEGEKSIEPIPEEDSAKTHYLPFHSRCGDAAFVDTYVHELNLLRCVQYARRNRNGLSGSYNSVALAMAVP
jgi:hypothetical protein